MRTIPRSVPGTTGPATGASDAGVRDVGSDELRSGSPPSIVHGVAVPPVAGTGSA